MEEVRSGMPPVIVCCACNGGIQGKEYNPNIPETAEEIADSVYEAYKAGAAMVHVHARNPEDLPAAAKTAETWKDVNQKIRERCPDIIVNNTTGGGFETTMSERLLCLEGNPEVASLNLGADISKFKMKERKPPFPHPHPGREYDDCIPFTYKSISHFAREMKKRGVKPELEVYHSGAIWIIQDLLAQGLLEKPYWTQTVMGTQTGSYPTVDNVFQLLREFPEDTVWLCSGIGPFQLPLTTLAILLGGHVRVGLEDNIYYRRGEQAKSNAQLVERTVRIAHELNREIATPSQAREILRISQVPSFGEEAFSKIGNASS